jgi:DNA-binding transcriptional LysR family regulator
MNLYNLKIFVDAARTKSMTKAAELNFISRPAVSHAIRNLENELSLDLVIHKPRAFELTPHGESLYTRGLDILEGIANLKSSLKNSTSGESISLTIGCVRSLTSDLLLSALVGLRKKYPGISVNVVIANSEVLVSYLEERKIDIALILGDDTLHGAQEVIIDRGSFVVAIPAKADPTKISYAMTERRPETERARTLFAREYGIEMPVFAEVPSWDAILKWIQAGQCGGIIPRFLVETTPSKDLRRLFPKVFPYEIKAIFGKSKYLDQVLKDFVAQCKASVGH